MATLPPSPWKRAQFSTGARHRDLERAAAGELASDDQLVDALRSLVGDHGFEIQHVAHRTVIESDARRAQEVATLARDLERGPDVVPLRERRLRTLGRTGIFERREPPCDQLHRRELAHEICES